MKSINNTTNRIFLLIIALLFALEILFLFESPKTVFAKDEHLEEPIIIYFFRVHGCSRCEKARFFLEPLETANPRVQIQSFEVYLSPQNRDLYLLFLKKMGLEPQGLPLIIIGDKYWVGFRDDMKEQIIETINSCELTGCTNIGKGLVDGSGNIIKGAQETSTISSPESNGNPNYSFDIPFLGPVDLSSTSLLASTAIIGFIDGVNPCSVWVLTVLLSLAIYTNSRKKTIIIGLLFIFVSAFVYSLFITGIFSIISFLSFLRFITLGISFMALVLGLINIKDYFLFKKGLSLTISDENKPWIYKKMRNVTMNSKSFLGIIVGTVVLSAGVSLVEFSCTSGFPVIWSNLLAVHHVDILTYVSLLFVYMLIYQIDEIGIFLFVVITMRATKMEEKHGRLLKLISGVLMLVLSAIMLINPNLMDNIFYASIIFGLTFLLTIGFHFIFERYQKERESII